MLLNYNHSNSVYHLTHKYLGHQVSGIGRYFIAISYHTEINNELKFGLFET